MVPADVRLISSKDLFVSQAVLTGESLPVEKYDTSGGIVEKSAAARLGTAVEPLALGNLCFMGTNVVSGSGTAVVLATGKDTYFGTLAKGILGHRAQTSFDIGVNKVTWVLLRFMLSMVPIVLLLNGFTKGDWGEAFFFALSVAVGLTPEMLPLVVTANLAKGAVHMARQQVIVKRLNAVQNFGAMDILCTDKTGTLTQDHVILEQHVDVVGEDCHEVLQLAFLNSYHQTGLKNLLDRAVLAHADLKLESDRFTHYQKVDEIPFDFMRRRMSVVVETEQGTHLLICKGAVEEIFTVCTQVKLRGEVGPVDATMQRHLVRVANAMNQDGLRVIAVASKELPPDQSVYHISDECELVLVGYMGFLDPPKETAGPAIRALQEHGVTVKVLTGDNDIVTRKVCKDVDLPVEAMTDAQLAAVAQKTAVFARLNPLHKARIIRALKQCGHTVGYLGDGINDALALRDADVGISVDTGVDIAKESADIILLEKSLLVLEQGVLQGRTVFGNIIKYIKMTASSNFGNVFSVLVASAFLPFLPMLPLQLLLQNLLYDLSQLSIPWDRMDGEFLERPRPWAPGGIARFMLCIGPLSSLFDLTTFALLWYGFGANRPAMQTLFQSGWFVEGLLSQTLIVHMIRTQRIPFLQSVAAPPVLLLTGTMMACGIALPFTSLGTAVGLQPLPWTYFPWLAATLLSYCALTQAVKVWYLRRFNAWL
jgi:P-type Mg2+ transporter